MKVVAKPIKCIAYFDENGIPSPMKFQIISDNGNKTIKVHQVIHKEIEKLAGNKMYVFDCQSEINNTLRRYQLKYEFDTCKWMLFKI